MIILILIVLHILGNLIFKPKHITLNCGIMAWAGKDPKTFNKQKFDILGIFNDSRGGDSCGVSTDGEIYYGVAVGQKTYKDFLVKKNYLKPRTIPIVIGHTRKSSVGVVNADNAHPFGFGVNEKLDSYEFIGCHNGTLHNHDDLAKTYEVKIQENDSRGIFKRKKIDSEVLLECIYKSKNFKVLSDYNGGAAVLFYNTEEPNVLYAFHGASAEYTNGKIEEERPLFFYQESKNSLYISSIEDSLLAIGGTEDTVFSFECNMVYKIKDGNIKEAEVFPVSRVNCLQRKSYANYSHTPRSCGYGNYESEVDYEPYNNKKGKKENEDLKNQNTKVDIDNIYDDTINKVLPSPIVFNKLRYFRNGHVVTGVYIFVKDYGLVQLCEDPRDIMKSIADIMGRPFDKKTGLFMKSTDYEVNNDDHILPYSIAKGVQPQTLYIYQGVMLDTEQDFIICQRSGNKSHEYLAHCSKHPVIDIEVTTRSKTTQGIINGDGREIKPFTGNISPLGSGKVYNIKDGQLKALYFINNSLSDELNKKDNPPVIQLNLAKDVKEQCDNEFIKSLEEGVVKKSKLENITTANKPIIDFLDPKNEDEDEEEIDLATSIDSGITNILTEIQEVNTVLIEHHSNPLVKNFLELNKDVINSYEEFLSENVNKLIMNS